MTTVGYGDFIPRSEEEVVFCTIVLITGATMFGYVVGNISNMVGNFNIGEKMATDFLQEIRNYMREQRITRRLSKEILSYYENWLEFRTAFDEKQLLRSMPRNLRIDTMCYIHRNTIPKVRIFKNQSEDFITTVMFLLRPQHHAMGSKIYSEGETPFELFFVIQGDLKVGHYLSHPRSEVVTRTLHVGDSFGQVALIRQTPRPNSVMAVTRCHVLSLSRASIDWMVSRYPPWAQILTHAMQSIYSAELGNQRWRKLRRSFLSLNLLFSSKKKAKTYNAERDNDIGAKTGTKVGTETQTTVIPGTPSIYSVQEHQTTTTEMVPTPTA